MALEPSIRAVVWLAAADADALESLRLTAETLASFGIETVTMVQDAGRTDPLGSGRGLRHRRRVAGCTITRRVRRPLGVAGDPGPYGRDGSTGRGLVG